MAWGIRTFNTNGSIASTFDNNVCNIVQIAAINGDSGRIYPSNDWKGNFRWMIHETFVQFALYATVYRINADNSFEWTTVPIANSYPGWTGGISPSAFVVGVVTR